VNLASAGRCSVRRRVQRGLLRSFLTASHRRLLLRPVPNNTSPQSLSGPGTKEVCIPSGKTVTYTIIGGGGGGGGVNTHNGGSATKMTGSFTTAGPVRLTLVGAGGGAGGQREVDGGVGGTGGAGYRTPSVLPKPLRRCR
jgi:hypothetical protein